MNNLTEVLPEWDNAGYIPPVQPGEFTSRQRSPYLVSLAAFIESFSTSSERIKLLEGFLRYRMSLYDIGITSGFQWVNGSFTENVELLRQKPPQDIDVVTLFEMPPNETQLSLMEKNENIFSPLFTKSQFNVDGYYVEIGNKMTQVSIENVTYWYSMWSHTRANNWKGFISINLDLQNHNNDVDLLSRKKEDLGNV